MPRSSWRLSSSAPVVSSLWTATAPLTAWPPVLHPWKPLVRRRWQHHHALAAPRLVRNQGIFLGMRSYPLSQRERVRVRGFPALRTSAKSLTPRPLPLGEGAEG